MKKIDENKTKNKYLNVFLLEGRCQFYIYIYATI